MVNKELKFYNRILKKDLLNKNFYKKATQLPFIKSAVLHFGCKRQDITSLAKANFILELITGNKSRFVKSKKPNLHLKIKKNTISGNLVKLNKKKTDDFLFNLSTEVFPKTKNIKINLNNNFENSITFSIPFSELTCFEEIEFYAYLLKNMPALTISILFNKTLNKIEQEFMLVFLKNNI